MINQIEEETGSLPENLPRGVPPETAQANPDVQAIIAPRLTMLMEIANSFLVTIIESMESVPYGIRWICKQIRSLTRVSGISFIGCGVVCATHWLHKVAMLISYWCTEKVSRGF